VLLIAGVYADQTSRSREIPFRDPSFEKMRNLALVSSSTVSFEKPCVSATAIDLDENIVYAVSEKQSFDGEVNVELWRVGKIGIAGLEGVKSFYAPRKPTSS
jgi:hypothetical protein